MCIQNKYLAIEINPNDIKDLKRLQNLEEDVGRLLSHVKHNAYDPKQMTKAEIEQRHKGFL